MTELSGPPWYGSPEHDRILVTIGDIAVTENWVITPSGNRPVGEVQWAFTNLARTTNEIPVWAIILAILFFFLCLLGLLFLLVKEERTTGYVQVTVLGRGLTHTTTLPVFAPQQIAEINGLVNMARSITASASQ